MIQDYKDDYGVEEDEEEAQKDIKSKVGISRTPKLSSSTLKHSCRRQSTPFVTSSTISQFLHRLGFSKRRFISELLVRVANLTARSTQIPTLF
jgi:hypothetical protein